MWPSKRIRCLHGNISMPVLTPSLFFGLWDSGARKDHERNEHTNDGGNCVQSAGAWHGAEEPVPLFCQHNDRQWFRSRAAKERTGRVRSKGGQGEAPRAPFNNPTQIPRSIRWHNESWLSHLKTRAGAFFPNPNPVSQRFLSRDQDDKSAVYLLKKVWRNGMGRGGGGGMKWSNQYRLCSSCPAAALSWQILITGRQEYKDRLVNGLSWFHTQQQGGK